MTKEQLAELLNGRQYGNEITKEEEQQAAKNGLVVVFGYSDDNAEFVGAIDDEVLIYEGGNIFLNGRSISKRKTANKIYAAWNEEGYSWIYRTQIPHVTFEIMDDDEKYCRGIVFSVNDLS